VGVGGNNKLQGQNSSSWRKRKDTDSHGGASYATEDILQALLENYPDQIPDGQILNVTTAETKSGVLLIEIFRTPINQQV
jgi:hypothetical protein